MRSFPTLAVALLFAVAPTMGAANERLIFHSETAGGKVLRSNRPDHLFNPASVVKVGTSLWALEELGPNHRYGTRVGYHGTRDGDTINGALVVEGGGDPDLHAENVILIARALNRLGIRKVSGDLIVTGNLWVGWEHGEAQRTVSASARATAMGRRFRAALDSNRWTRSSRASWQAMAERRGWPTGNPPSVRVSGSVVRSPDPEYTTLLVHRSNPLREILRRFNIYSNNDIVRIADVLGGVEGLEAFLRTRLEAGITHVDLSTASGEFRNRMTPRLIVRMMREMRQAATAAELAPHHFFPLLGCDPGPTRRMFPMLATGRWSAAVTCKTGTLSTTDEGVAVLSGWFESPEQGEIYFVVAAERAGGNLRRWRRAEQDWLLDLITEVGGARTNECNGEHLFSDGNAKIDLIGTRP